MSMALVLQQTAAAREQLREQIRQTVRDATQAAEEAAKQTATQKGGKMTVSTDRGIITVPIPPIPPTIPGTVQMIHQPEIPPQVEPISIAFFAMIAIIVVGLPIMRALARRIDRGTPVAAPIPREVTAQLEQISQSVDAIAIEVERISEGQRFTTKMLNDRQRDITMVSPGASGSQG